jgi:hypothetical protein
MSEIRHPPSQQLLDVVWRGSMPAAEMSERLLPALRSAGATPTGWQIRADDAPSSNIAALPAALRGAGDPFSASYSFADRTVAIFSRDRAGRPGGLRWSRQHELEGASAEWAQMAVRLFRELTRQGLVDKAALARLDRVGFFLPDPPVVQKCVAVVTSLEAVREAYDEPAVFGEVWDSMEVLGDRVLCARGVGTLEAEPWIRSITPGQLALARAAKPKRTKWYVPFVRGLGGPYDPEPWEKAIHDAGPAVIRPVGYLPEEKLLELAGFAPPGVHVALREVLMVRAIVKAKRDGQGRVIETVRVVFADEPMAHREKRVLLDVGARVFFMSPTGADVEITS